MSKFELSLPTTNGLRGWQLNAFLVLWAVLGLAFNYGILTGFPWLAGKIPQLKLLIYATEFAVFVAGGLAFVFVPYQLALSRARGRRVIVNDCGFGLPPSLGGVGRNRWVAWSDIRTCVFDRRKLALRCRPKSALPFSLSLKSLADSDREQFLLAFESWAPSELWTGEIVTYTNELQNELRGIGQVSHGQLFDLELARRFTSPTFVPLDPGARLRSGSLRVVRQLAFGGFSAVYEADDSVFGPVVLKESVVPDNTSEEAKQKAEELFAREAHLLQKLDHPGIVRVFDHFVEDGRSYLTMELVAGETLRELVRQRGPQPDRLVIEWCIQVLDVLRYLHSQTPPIVHRDVTPDNLMISNTGHIMLIDFGASNEYVGSATGTLVGKHSYMPVEQIRGKAEPRSDLFALGATMYFLLTGSDPEPLVNARPSCKSASVSPGLDELVAATTESDPDARPQNAEEFRARLLQLSSQSDLSRPHTRSS